MLLDINGFYIGTTTNLKRRFKNHKDRIGGIITSKFGVKYVDKTFECDDYKKTQQLEDQLVKEYRRKRIKCWGSGYNDSNKPF